MKELGTRGDFQGRWLAWKSSVALSADGIDILDAGI